MCLCPVEIFAPDRRGARCQPDEPGFASPSGLRSADEFLTCPAACIMTGGSGRFKCNTRGG